MPVVYQVPAEIKQPVVELDPLSLTLRYPFPLNGAAVPVGAGLVAVPVGTLVVVLPPLPLGKYLMPVAGHVDLVPSGSEATNSPVWTEPRTV